MALYWRWPWRLRRLRLRSKRRERRSLHPRPPRLLRRRPPPMPRTHEFFANADQAKIKKLLAEQFCVILGGPCTYTGRDMATAHKDMGVDRAAFNALVEDLQLAMDARRIPFRAQNKLLAILAPMHREVITR